MKDFEREEANIDELEQIGEFINFKEEDYRCNELINNEFEEFKVKEIQPQSFVESETSNNRKVKNKNEDELRKKINNQLKTSINTSATTTTTVTVVTVTAAVSVGIVSFPFDDYGELEFKNYRVDTRVVYDVENDKTIKYKDIEIYFNEELKEDYICHVLNKENDEILELDLTKDYVKFIDLELDIYNFEVQIMNSNYNVIEKFDININTVCEYEYLEETPFRYTVTYNEDNTMNLYFDVNMIYEDENIYNFIELIDEDGSKLDYIVQEQDDILIIEDIKENNFEIMTYSYYEKEGNYYLINRNYISDFIPYKLSYEMSADLNNLSILIYNEAVKNIDVSVKYLDDNTIEKFIVPKNSINESNEAIIKLSKISKEIEVTLSGEFIMYGEMDFIKQYKGVFSKEIIETKIVKPKVYDNLELLRIEVTEDQYTNSLSASLYFDGYLLNGSYIDVNVYDSVGNLIANQKNITSLKETILFDNLNSTEIYTFEYILKDGSGSEKYKDQYETSVNISSEYSSADYTFYYINPSEVYLTYNDDMTYNIYFPSEFENRSEFDIYYKITVINYEDNEVYDLIGNEKTPCLLNCEPYSYYSLVYSLFVKEGITYYSLYQDVAVSGTIYISYDDNGYIIGQKYCYYEMIEDGIYKIMLSAKIYDDVKVNITLDNKESIEVVVPMNEISFDVIESSFLLDLSNYQFETAELEIVGMMNEFISFEERVDKNNIKGNESALYIYDILIE